MADGLVYRQAKTQVAALTDLNADLLAHERQFAWLDGLQTALGVLIVNGTALAVLAAAIPRVDALYVATLALAAIATFEAITPLASAAANLGTATSAAHHLFEIIDLPRAVLEDKELSPIPVDYGIQFEHVTFRYTPDGSPVFNDLTFAAKSGQHIAILGPSGAGKSTLVNLLLRFWEFENGTIYVGGHDIRLFRPLTCGK